MPRINLNSSAKIFAEHLETGEIVEIDDLYWFEENGVRSFDEPDSIGNEYKFWIEIAKEEVGTNE